MKRFLLWLLRCRHKDTSAPFRNYVVCLDCGIKIHYEVGAGVGEVLIP